MCHLHLLLFLSLQLLLLSSAQNDTVPSTSSSSSPCPLNFTTLSTLVRDADVKPSNDVGANCGYIAEGLRLVLSQYLQSTGSFYPPVNTSESCWTSYDSVVDSFLPGFKIRSSCGFRTQWISEGCMNISTRSEFERLVPQSALDDAVSNCNQSLENGSPCASCLTSLTTLQASYLTSNSPFNGNISDCTNLPLIYAGALINQYGPSDPGTAKCLFSLDFSSSQNRNNRKKKILLISLITVVGFIGICSIFVGGYFFSRLKKNRAKMAEKKRRINRVGSGAGPNLSSIGGSTHLMKFGYDEIKRATKNFHRDNLIGKGGYGNVYKGLLPDNTTEIAVKRFKNCSAAGDASFTHEVEVIASIRHVNLVELRGYCVATTNLEGHQRIIVCDLMHNGSLHDHLYGSTKLSWPVRQKIALGMARGLAYLHYGAQPSIIHRDIKASNILLDDNFEAKVADFGLAKFNPEGFSHLSTRVAGTMGYVAPEYALYGQLTERSDVFSFGVVLLELLSGKKAILSDAGNPSLSPSLVTDWAWSLVRKGHGLDVIEEGMPELGPESVMEKYVLTAVLCSHPQLYARPTMDQVVKILETENMQVPAIPERPISFNAELEDIERSASSSGSGQMSTSGGFQSYYSMGHVDFGSHNGLEEVEDNGTNLR
ncbi:probable LRR receptor-like serine/threonine-protein kinase RKF3 [Spinacia oleracea]|uniref:non-specific serine/threonine protein kinase n=1 Tax=Spinacia oleracea TaxID=3562 RepID=A0A9R0JQG6_SPIOL|nr:probable LRR receptor-like serine/threonine-protein kinase RKF3 [Spinacia oleracea]